MKPIYFALDTALKLDGFRTWIRDWRKVLVEWRKGHQESEQRPGWARLDDEPLTLFAHDCVRAGKLELARNSYGLVSAVPEELHVSLDGHGALLA